MKKLLLAITATLALSAPMTANASSCKNVLFEITDLKQGAILVANVPSFQSPMIMATKTYEPITNFKVNGQKVEYLVKEVPSDNGDQRIIFIPKKNSKIWRIDINNKWYNFKGNLCLGGK